MSCSSRKVRRQPTEWEKTFANNVTNKVLIFKIYKQLIQLNIKKTQPNQKVDKKKLTFCFSRGSKILERKLCLKQSLTSKCPLKVGFWEVR